MAPYLSIVIPTFNRREKLERSVRSVLLQADDDCEVIVVDDASTDDTRVWLSQQEDPRLRVVLLEGNRGVNVARNRGIDAARGTWLVLLDSDDQLAPGALTSIRESTRLNEASWLLGLCRTADGRSTVRDERVHGAIAYQDYLRGAVTGEYLPVVTREAMMSNPFREDIRGGEGITWNLMAKAGLGPRIVPAVWRIYDTDGPDRLSVKRNNYARLAAVFRADLATLWREYLRHAPTKLASVALRATYYAIAARVTR